MKSIAGILIAGLSRRMGRPKALIELASQTMLDRSIAIAGQVCDEVVLLGQPAFPLPPLAARLRLLSDTPPEIGPLGGLAALLTAAAPDPAILLACDLPNLDAALLYQLLDAIDCSIDAVAFKTSPEAAPEPCCTAFMPSAAKHVDAQITNHDHALHRLLTRLRIHTINLSPTDAARLANMNTPADVPAAKLQ